MRGFSKELVSKFIQLGHDFIEEVTYLNAGILKKMIQKRKTYQITQNTNIVYSYSFEDNKYIYIYI